MMKIFKSREFAFLLVDLERHQARCEQARIIKKHDVGMLSPLSMPEGDCDVSQVSRESILELWHKAAILCEDIKLDHAAETIRLKITHVAAHPDKVDYSSLCADFRTIFEAISGDFWHRKFAQIPEEYGTYVNNDALLGPEIKSKFKEAEADIREAGNCIAIDSGTAAVFYLMRAVELGLRRFCSHLGISRVRKSKKPGKEKYVLLEYAQWEKILDDAQERVDAKINKMKPGKAKQRAQEFYIPILKDIRGFKDAWRNHVMHARATYTVKDAEAVLGHVKGFLLRLSARVSE